MQQAWLWRLVILLVPNHQGIGLGTRLSLGRIFPSRTPESFDYYSGLEKHDLQTDFEDGIAHSLGSPVGMSYTAPYHGPEATWPVQKDGPGTQSPDLQPSMLHQSAFREQYKDPARTAIKLEFPQDGRANPLPDTFRESPPAYSQLPQDEGPHMSRVSTTPHSASPVNQFGAGFPPVYPEMTRSHFHQAASSSISNHFNTPMIENIDQAGDTNHYSNDRSHQLAQSNNPALERNSDYQVSGGIIHPNSAQTFVSNNQKSFGPVAPFDPASIFPSFCYLSSYKFQYYVFEFEPSVQDISGRLVMEAVNSLDFQDGTKFITLDTSKIHTGQESVKRMFCINRTINDIQTFLNLFTTLYGKHMNKPPKTSDADGDSPAPKFDTLSRQQLIESFFPSDVSGSDNEGVDQGVVSIYKQHVLEGCKESLTEFSQLMKQRILDSCSGKPKLHQKMLGFFDLEMSIFPLYLIYVDMISALIPVNTLDNQGELLGTQRKTAARFFFEQVEDHIFEVDHQAQSQQTEAMMISKTLRRANGVAYHKTSFMWKALHNWILYSRAEMLSLIDTRRKTLSMNIKAFFNYMVFSLMNKHAPHGQITASSSAPNNNKKGSTTARKRPAIRNRLSEKKKSHTSSSVPLQPTTINQD